MSDTPEISVTDRQGWMSLLATADEAALVSLWRAHVVAPAFDWLRRPETGAVMVRGRAGGTGAPFNLGEMTVTRCSVSLRGGEIGHGYVQGRSKPKSEIAALLDALMQTSAAHKIRENILDPLAAQKRARQSERAAKAAATKVEFFTLVRGED